MQTDCYVKFYRAAPNIGEVILETNARDLDAFLGVLPRALLNTLETASQRTQGGNNEQEEALSEALLAIVEIACKLKGYKADGVSEQRVLFKGSRLPESNIELYGSAGVRNVETVEVAAG